MAKRVAEIFACEAMHLPRQAAYKRSGPGGSKAAPSHGNRRHQERMGAAIILQPWIVGGDLPYR
jgi:hypothetical protein